jgi:hypothetical protein
LYEVSLSLKNEKYYKVWSEDFYSKEHNLNRRLIVNLFFIATKRDTKTDGIAKHIFLCISQEKPLKLQLLVIT